MKTNMSLLLAILGIEYAPGELEMSEFGNNVWPKAASQARQHRPIRRLCFRRGRIANT
jgi:hypothetical protein